MSTFFCLPFSPNALASWQDQRASIDDGTVDQIGEGKPSTSLDQETLTLIEKRIAELDHSQYGVRQEAMAQLSRFKGAAVELLAYELLKGSPESNWRIRQVLEEIAFTNDFETMYRVAAVLKVRFPEIDLARMRTKWQANKRDNAINRLRKLGVEVTDLSDNVAFQDWAPVRQPVFIIDGGVARIDNLVIDEKLTESEAAKLKSELEKITGGKGRCESEKTIAPDERDFATLTQKEQVAIILKSDLETNRKRVEQSGRRLSLPRAESLGATVQLLFRGNWQGQDEDLELFDALSISQVSMVNAELEPGLMARMLTPNLQGLIVENCSIPLSLEGGPKRNREGGEPALMVSYLTLNQKLDADKILEHLATFGCGFSVVRLIKGSADDQVLETLTKFKSIQMLEIENAKLTERSFGYFAQHRNVGVISLIKCSFPIKAYREFEKERSEVRIEFQATAFLGVGASKSPGKELEINNVVAGSAASEAGVKIGDVIEKVEGAVIEEFDDLRLMIAQRDIGDTIELEVRRDGTLMKVRAKLRSNEQRFLFR